MVCGGERTKEEEEVVSKACTRHEGAELSLSQEDLLDAHLFLLSSGKAISNGNLSLRIVTFGSQGEVVTGRVPRVTMLALTSLYAVAHSYHAGSSEAVRAATAAAVVGRASTTVP